MRQTADGGGSLLLSQCSVSDAGVQSSNTNLELDWVVDVIRVVRDGRRRCRHADELEGTLRLMLYINNLDLKDIVVVVLAVAVAVARW
jgi:hypothetical protein